MPMIEKMEILLYRSESILYSSGSDANILHCEGTVRSGRVMTGWSLAKTIASCALVVQSMVNIYFKDAGW